jgi:hypothetical protein
MSNNLYDFHLENVPGYGPCMVFEDSGLHGTKIELLIGGKWVLTYIMFIKKWGITIVRLPRTNEPVEYRYP